MSQLKKEDIKQEVFDLYDDYAHNRIDRRDFAQRLSAYAVGGATVASLMSFLMPDYKGQIQIQAQDPRLKSEYINYPSPKGAGTINIVCSVGGQCANAGIVGGTRKMLYPGIVAGRRQLQYIHTLRISSGGIVLHSHARV